MKLSGWQIVAIILGAIAGVVAITLSGHDPTVIIALLGALGIGAIVGGVQQVRDNTNGTQKQLTSIIQDAMVRLHMSPPPTSTPPPTEPPASE